MSLPAPTQPNPPLTDIPFVNEMRLNWRNWLIAIGLIVIVLLGTPRIWKKIERFDTGNDYRIPYSLSRDYWLYNRRLEQVVKSTNAVILGDSVTWGEYVAPDGTLSHFLSEESGKPEAFVNGGVNGLFPLALEGLVDYYGKPLKGRKIMVNCNLLWMSSPKADLQTHKEEKFNHSRLVPQFTPEIPCYKADANERLSVIVERNVSFMSWVTHLQSAYYSDKSVPIWTLQDDGEEPPHYPNAYKNPFSQIKLEVPAAPKDDPERGPASPRHKSWLQNGGSPAQFEWVEIESSLQWGAFKRAIEKLRSRGNQVFVLVGPFNEHMIGTESMPGYRKLYEGVTAWLKEHGVAFAAPKPLASELYADASHPLTEGYRLLATELFSDAAFNTWRKE
jgi:hypothetical protein